MASRRRRRSSSSVLVCVRVHNVGHLVYRFDVKRLFSDDDESSRRRRRPRPRGLLPLPPSPVACFGPPLSFPMNLVASAGGDKIVAATWDGHIIVYDATRCQYTHDHVLRCKKPCPILLALSSRPSSSSSRRDMCMLVATAFPDLSGSKPGPSFEALRLTSGGRLQPLPDVPPPVLPALPVPPPVLPSPAAPGNSWWYRPNAQVTCYFVAGGRVWLSVTVGPGNTGTYSLDMATNAWRREGSWLLPCLGEAVYAPDLGLLLGFQNALTELYAIDIEARPPVIRQRWSRLLLLPAEDDGYSPDQDFFSFGGLAYLGRGRLCISWSSVCQNRRMMLALTAVEIVVAKTGELLRRRLGSRCYHLPPGNQHAAVLPVLL